MPMNAMTREQKTIYETHCTQASSQAKLQPASAFVIYSNNKIVNAIFVIAGYG